MVRVISFTNTLYPDPSPLLPFYNFVWDSSENLSVNDYYGRHLVLHTNRIERRGTFPPFPRSQSVSLPRDWPDVHPCPLRSFFLLWNPWSFLLALGPFSRSLDGTRPFFLDRNNEGHSLTLSFTFSERFNLYFHKCFRDSVSPSLNLRPHLFNVKIQIFLQNTISESLQRRVGPPSFRDKEDCKTRTDSKSCSFKGLALI